ncbi:copper chaperone of lysine biosynthesis protein [Saitozyma podzolica]|uniref:holo-[acyl-carrier-protein] synthase n=1 Tax=Saitozyma podzolica TaxID=1890683 RepID=A0A427YQ41_9TREE|nr:copper chaperone of lysine biosynthesis protein [Saitozyma podzolica]
MRVLAFALPDPDYEYLLSLLDPPERDRVVRFRLPEDRLRSLVGRLALWWYLLVEGHISGDTRPTFGRKARGKPTLSTPVLSPPLDFNNSHEGPFVLLGVARGVTAELGVDVMLPPLDPVELQDSLDLQLTSMEKHHLAIPLPPASGLRGLPPSGLLRRGIPKPLVTEWGLGWNGSKSSSDIWERFGRCMSTEGR